MTTMHTFQTKKEQVESGFTIVKDAMDIAGCVTYWRCGVQVSIEALTKAWIEAELDPQLLRKAPEPVTALRRAVMDQQARHRLVRGIGKGQWAIVDEHVVETKEGEPAQEPTYETVGIVRFKDGQPWFERTDSEIIDAVEAAFTRQQGLYDPSDITSWFVDLAHKNNAVTLRESGGVYFIPKPAMEFWTTAADVIEKVSGNAISVFRIPAMRNSEAVVAITDAISMEAAQVAAKMEEELLATGDEALGKRAVTTRQGDVEKLLGKLVDYEKLLGLQLDVRSRVEALQANLAAVAMTADSGTEA